MIFGIENGPRYLFFEDFRYKDDKAVISCAELGQAGELGPSTTVLERDYHLSYPFVFAHQGQIYMLPESSQHRTLELYRAVAFPYRWVLHSVVMEGLRITDATLFQHDGRFWLFATIGAEGASDWDDLHLFSSCSPLHGWIPHPLNPVVSDVRRARPAGRLFHDRGDIIRPSQDSATMYGHAIVLNRIDVLSETEYHETPVGRISPAWLPGLVGTHTLAWEDGVEVLDGRKWVTRPLPRLLRVPTPRSRARGGARGS